MAVLAMVAIACAEDTVPPSGGPSEMLLRQCRADLLLDDEQCAEIARWRLPAALPVARGNRYADDERAAMLGRRIFFDAGFATIPDVSCASCHMPDRAFADGRALSEVIPGMPVARNSPTVLNVAWMDTFMFWDGRADSLWSQPLFALEGANEMGTTRLQIAHRIFDLADYRSAYEAIFGALPELGDLGRFPAVGKPGDPSWEGMSAADRQAVDGVAANVGKSLEAYMRRIASGPSAVDRYLDGEREALSAEERVGLREFVRSGCPGCHFGPSLSDGRFHQVAEMGDRGRAAGVETLLASPFSSAGPHFDDDAGEPLPLPTGPTAADEHAFRTPSLRNVAMTAPYGHAGMHADLNLILTPDGMMGTTHDERIEPFLLALTGSPDPAWATPP